MILPVFNAGEYIRACIESVLVQTEKEFELLIINDGSSDNSEEMILTFKDSRIRYVKQGNQGVAVTRNKAIDMAKGEFIVFQDADDISIPSRFEVLKRHFYDESVGLVHSDVLLIDRLNKPVGYYSNRNLDKKRALRYFLKTGTPICGGSVMARREVFQNARYDPSLEIGEDNDILSKITQFWNSVHVPEPLYLYRRHENNSAGENRYHVIFAHVQKLLKEYSLKELVPEIDWKKGHLQDNESKALAIIALFLHRRGMYLHVDNWIRSAAEKAKDPETICFNEAVTSIINRDFSKALAALELCKTKDAIIENYKGECFALKGEWLNAMNCFSHALKLIPDYNEAIDNLKALGGVTGFNIGDITWQKFH